MVDSELRLYAEALISVTDFAELDTAVVFRRSSPVLGLSFTIVVSKTEPVNQVLPLNVLWLCMDESSDFYKKFLQRVSKVAVAPYQNTWQVVTSMAQLNQIQSFDNEDSGWADRLAKATDTSYGIARLTEDPAAVGQPKFVAQTDSRLSDKRVPTEHSSMHPNLPAAAFTHTGGVITVQKGPASNHVLVVAESSTEASMKTLTASDLGG